MIASFSKITRLPSEWWLMSISVISWCVIFKTYHERNHSYQHVPVCENCLPNLAANHPAPDIITSSGIDAASRQCLDPEKIFKAAKETQFTVVIPTIDRIKTLNQVLTHYLKMPEVARVILAWFKFNGTVPEAKDLVDSSLTDKLVVKQLTEDNLMLRFTPFPEIQTEAVFSVDDDLLVDWADLTHGFEAWKKNPWSLIGWSARHPQYKDGTYVYDWRVRKNYTLILTNSAFYHNHWNNLIKAELPREIWNTVKDWTNCEDIAMNFLISYHCGERGTFYVKPIKHMPKKLKDHKSGLNTRSGHYKQRGECIRRFAEYYHEMPLHNKQTIEQEI